MQLSRSWAAGAALASLGFGAPAMRKRRLRDVVQVLRFQHMESTVTEWMSPASGLMGSQLQWCTTSKSNKCHSEDVGVP